MHPKAMLRVGNFLSQRLRNERDSKINPYLNSRKKKLLLSQLAAEFQAYARGEHPYVYHDATMPIGTWWNNIHLSFPNNLLAVRFIISLSTPSE